MRRYCRILLSLLTSGVVAIPAVAHAWGPDGVTVKLTSLSVPIVSACSDGAYGAIVVWQEDESGGPGPLRGQHVLSDGTLDPFWNANGAVVCSALVDRKRVNLLPDGLGGAYVSWMESTSLYLTHLDSAGGIASGWPARGRFVANLPSSDDHADVASDGSSGVYVTWTGNVASLEDPRAVYALRLGPNNSGWSSPLNVSGVHSVSTVERWAKVAPDGEGGAFVAWAASSADTNVVPSALRLSHVTASRTIAPGWPGQGMLLGAFDWTHINPAIPHIDLGSDGGGGVYYLSGHPPATSGINLRLQRLQSDGSTAPGWPAAGQTLWREFEQYEPSSGILHLVPDGSAGAFVGSPRYFSEGIREIWFLKWTGQPGFPHAPSASPLEGYEALVDGHGGLYVADFVPFGPWSMWCPPPSIRLSLAPTQGSWNYWSEVQLNSPPVSWYGDIAIAPTGDGGVFYFWSQHRERFGLFARRFNSEGQVLAVSPPVHVQGIRARFRPGSGIVVAASFNDLDAGRIDLFDVHGRCRARTSFANAGGSIEMLIDGTARLESGVYFLRLDARKLIGSTKVTILR